MSHTPGPWKPYRSLTCGHIRAGHNENSDPKKEWTDDDLRLIAEAPAMLEVLRQVERQIIHQFGASVWMNDFDYLCEIIQRIDGGGK